MEETAPALHSSGSTDVECHACIGKKRKAEQTCIECEESYCEHHLSIHNSLHVGKRHRLMELNAVVRENICPDHGKKLFVFCRTDQVCICHLCITDKHRGHVAIPVEEEVANKQASAIKALEKNEKNFTELIQSIKDNQSKVKELIQGQTNFAVKEVEGFIKTLQKEISNMRTLDADLQRLQLLSHSSTDVQFLERTVSLPSLIEYKKPFVFLVHPYNSFERDSMAVNELIEKLNTTSKLSLLMISRKVANTKILRLPPPETQKEFLKFASKLTFNTNSAHKSLILRNENKEVKASHLLQDYPEHTQRFNCRVQILCKEGLRGSPKYWEVEIGGGTWICVAVSYQGICRKGKQRTLFGRNDQSWGLRCKHAQIEFWHDNEITFTKFPSYCSKIGVYLDYRAGILAFYNVSDNMSLIYKHNTVFKEPVYPGFGLAGNGSYVRLCDPVKKETSVSSPFNFF
ncbi:tripartite motif-containing protein 16 isoform X2 [Puntigrus tetrazona]|uniref:tripartite motif-containing protein 16 isoform X2 n=1 Tax=Puntigrus tetrazona TaxID=1606681 RepID=UPI001C8A7281|nr:tripartite motif-containing protein 16 isoform X2 [Puntigrus tetrazona]